MVENFSIKDAFCSVKLGAVKKKAPLVMSSALVFFLISLIQSVMACRSGGGSNR